MNENEQVKIVMEFKPDWPLIERWKLLRCVLMFTLHPSKGMDLHIPATVSFKYPERVDGWLRVKLRATKKQAEQRLAEAEKKLQYNSECIRMEWSDRVGVYHPTQFYEAVLSCSLDHYYDRGDGMPWAMPDNFRKLFAPIIEKHLSAIKPDWKEKSVYMNNEQRAAFESELKIANAAAIAQEKKDA